MILNTFSHACLPSLQLLWRGVYSDLLPIFKLLLCFKTPVDILDIITLLDMCFPKIFSRSYSLSFFLLKVPFVELKFLIFALKLQFHLCPSYFYFLNFIEFIGVALVNKITQVSVYHSIMHHLYIICSPPKVVSFHHHLSPPHPLPFLPPLIPFPQVITILLSVSVSCFILFYLFFFTYPFTFFTWPPISPPH